MRENSRIDTVELGNRIRQARVEHNMSQMDQVELIARSVGRELGLTPVPVLQKIRHNPPQSGIQDDSTRRANVLGAYRLKDPRQVHGKRILLLDDILTTGATAGECARMLRMAGATEVHCAAVAAARKR